MLKKQLGSLDLFSIAAGAMISSGLFVLPGAAFDVAGPSIILAYFLAGLLNVPVLVAKIELATAMPMSGGSYYHIGRSIGPFAGVIAGIGNWLSIVLKAAFALVGIGAMLTDWIPGLNEREIRLIALVACFMFTAINLVSTKHSGRFQTVLVLSMIAILAMYIIRALPSVDGERIVPFFWQAADVPEGSPWGLRATFLATGMVFISFGGLTKAVDVSEEVTNPTRSIPAGLIAAFIVVTVVYVMTVFVTVGNVASDTLRGSLIPISLGARGSMGAIGPWFIDMAAFFAFVTTANAGILSAARSPMAMSRDGLMPAFLSKTSKRFHTPHYAILLTSGTLIIFVAFLSIQELAKTASAVLVSIFVLDNISLMVMRHSGLQNYRPTFKAPFYPWSHILSSIVYVLVILNMGWTSIAITVGFIFFSILWYLTYVGRKLQYESAFVHMVRQVVSRSLLRSGLEDELQKVVFTRDEVTEDRFDELVRHCAVMDIEESISMKEMFRRVSKTLSERIEMSEDDLYELLVARERQSSTVIHPGLAIPHIVVEGSGVFHLILLRCKQGVVYSELNPPITTAFVLVGSQDERNFHLKTLMNIAHIVQAPGFEQAWEGAATPEALRDLVLLSRSSRPPSLPEE